jgi:Tol biopolymer transport system component
MADLHERFTGLDEIDAPDLLPEIRRRQPRPPEHQDGAGPRRRAGTAAVALLVAVAATAFVVRAFWGLSSVEDRQTPGLAPPGPGEIQADVQGVVVTWPKSWTVVQLTGEVGGSWPLLQVTNYQVDLNDPACPHDVGLPAHGVLLYVQRDLAQDPGSLSRWPVTPDLGAAEPGSCGRGARVSWRFDQVSFQATLAMGASASDEDVARLLQVFKDLRFGDPRIAEGWQRVVLESHQTDSRGSEDFRSFYEQPKYVVWGVNALERTSRTWLVPADPVAADGGYVIGSSISGSIAASAGIMSEPGDRFFFGGSQRGPESPVVESYGYVSLDVERLMLETEDGRVIEATIGPSFARFGVDLRPTYLQFEPPLDGTFVALDAGGDVLERERYALWAETEAATPPSLSPGSVNDGDLVAALEGRLGDNSVVAIDPETGKVAAVPGVDGYVSGVSISPDGRTLALAVYGKGRDYVIATMNADGSGFRPLTRYGSEINGLGDVAWSPDGTKVAFTTIVSPRGGASYTEADILTDLHVVSLADGAVADVTEGDHISHFSWSPDGTRFVVSRQRAEGDRLLYDLFIIGADGSEELRLTYDGVSMAPQWSSRGPIAYIGSATGEFNHRDVFVMQEDGSSPTQWSDDREVEESIAWLSDGTRFAYTKFTKRSCQILVQTLEGSSPTRVVTGAEMGGCPIDLDW